MKESLSQHNNIEQNIQCMRGIFALTVFFTHLLVFRQYVNTSKWASVSDVEANAAKQAVELFFILSGYLFYTVINKEINLFEYYIKRVIRILPVLMILWMYVYSFIWFDFFSNELGSIVINYSILTAGVTWTLWYEWLFYISLTSIPLVLFNRNKRLFVLTLIATFIILQLKVFIFDYYLNFIIGILVYHIINKTNKVNFFKSNLFIGYAAYIGLIFSYELDPLMEDVLRSMVFLTMIKSIKIPAVNKYLIKLGDISYEIYLLQGPVIVTIAVMFGLERFSELHDLTFVIYSLMVALILVFISSFIHIFDERLRRYLRSFFRSDFC